LSLVISEIQCFSAQYAHPFRCSYRTNSMQLTASSKDGDTDDDANMKAIRDFIGMTDAELNRIISRVPEVRSYDATDSKICISFLAERLSLTNLEIKKKLVLRLPQVLGYDYKNDIKPSLDLLQKRMDLDDEELSALILKCPQIIGLEYEQNLEPKIQAVLEEVGLDLDIAKSEILRKPSLLQLTPRGAAKGSA